MAQTKFQDNCIKKDYYEEILKTLNHEKNYF